MIILIIYIVSYDQNISLVFMWKMDPIKDLMQGKLFQKCTHLLYCSVLSLGGNVNTRRMSKPDCKRNFKWQSRIPQKKQKINNIINTWSDKALKGTFANRALPSLHRGSFEVTLTVQSLELITNKTFFILEYRLNINNLCYVQIESFFILYIYNNRR